MGMSGYMCGCLLLICAAAAVMCRTRPCTCMVGDIVRVRRNGGLAVVAGVEAHTCGGYAPWYSNACPHSGYRYRLEPLPYEPMCDGWHMQEDISLVEAGPLHAMMD